MKKLVIFHHVANMGGGTISLVDICHMLSHEYEVTAIIPEKNSEQLTKCLSKYAKVIHFKERLPQFAYYSGSPSIISNGFLRSFFVNRKEIDKIIKLIEDEDPDVIIANSVVQLRMGKFLSHLNAKKIMYIRETFRENIISRCMIKYINKYFDGVLCIAPYEKRYANFNIPCEVVGDCVFRELSNEDIRLNKEKFNVLYMGGAVPLKGFNVLLETTEYINSDDINFVIAGNVFLNMPRNIKNKVIHKKELAYEKRSKELLKKHEAKIERIGFTKDIGMIMQQADVVVFPSTKPHQPRPAIEAGEYDAAVILSDYPQTKDYFVDGYHCLTFKSKDSKDLAKKVEVLYNDKALCEKLKKNNKDMNLKYHNFEKESKELISFLEKIQLKEYPKRLR